MIEKFDIPKLDKVELLDKLSNIRLPNEFKDNSSIGWKCGTPSWAVQEMVRAWKEGFNWEEKRKEMSQWHHYKTTINELNIHFIHEVSSKTTDAIPIILLHGWPSSFYEFHKIIEPLRDGINSTQSFHVVIPSLPGYGFSEAPKTDGSGSIAQIANILHKLMIKLGYQKYMIYGTDWGATIGTFMAQNFSNSCLGFITNMPIAMPPLPTLYNIIFHPIKVILFIISLFLGFDLVYGKGKTKRLKTTAYANVDKDETAGYRAIQGTRPYTLAFGLTDSPIGLLAWMLEPYHQWTYFPSSSHQLVLPATVSVDEFLTQVTIYWISNCMSSSYRIYYEVKKNHNKALKDMMKTYVSVPMAVSYFENEVVKLPRDWIEVSSHLVQFKSYDKGGHFPALEVPSLLIEDIQKFGSYIVNKNSIQQEQKMKKLL
ncbi:Alpha/Beta hydrolase protein [Cokeromyces recurvatus]|uniref:Alpha/Beta hydrolase protein n=1 Tax=Cokeromyces recurvatus TaxID=90255 RepID=UPI00221FD2CD|nr:Alpha/Beta hydrolase protein [Cokeromyces recurvatus]KAI7906869.1 Alpha/Beta hydrolase protein [Cokeromyces recurvatus]